jgi:hypothetical protein
VGVVGLFEIAHGWLVNGGKARSTGAWR